MDPLGLVPETVDVNAIKRWCDVELAELGLYKDEEKKHETSVFPFRPDLNRKVALWVGDVSVLGAEAIVHSTTETLTDRSNPVSVRIYERGGPRLLQEVSNNLKSCRTGEAKYSRGYDLPARFVIHTVGPKYNAKYQSAAETALYSCYRHVLQTACELQASTVGLCVVNSVRRGYPPDEGAHIALRTVRRFLDRHGSKLELIVFVVDDVDSGIYELLMPLYFPRNEREEDYALYHLPLDLGDENGEPVVADRQIRIIHNPHHNSNKEDLLDSSLDLPKTVGSHAFTHMEGDIDRQKLLGIRPRSDPVTDILQQEVQAKERYERLLRKAKTEDLSEVSGIGCLYQCGVDKFGRPVIVFVGRFFRWKEVDLNKALLYIIYLLDPLVKGDYVIVYFHTLTNSDNHPPLSWIKDVYNILDYKYKKNLKAFYIMHPTFWTRLMVWWFTTFMASQIKKKVHSLNGVEYLYAIMDKDQLEIPAFITEYDMSTNGLHYYHPTLP